MVGGDVFERNSIHRAVSALVCPSAHKLSAHPRKRSLAVQIPHELPPFRLRQLARAARLLTSLSPTKDCRRSTVIVQTIPIRLEIRIRVCRSRSSSTSSGNPHEAHVRTQKSKTSIRKRKEKGNNKRKKVRHVGWPKVAACCCRDDGAGINGGQDTPDIGVSTL